MFEFHPVEERTSEVMERQSAGCWTGTPYAVKLPGFILIFQQDTLVFGVESIQCADDLRLGFAMRGQIIALNPLQLIGEFRRVVAKS
jgi:hypothetical protein